MIYCMRMFSYVLDEDIYAHELMYLLIPSFFWIQNLAVLNSLV